MNTKVFEEKYSKLNPRQKEAVDAVYGPVMVVAGPGTGKTTLLTLRIANIILKTGAKPEEILALTFTDSGVKAMREKLREVIGDSAFRVNIFTFHSFGNYMRSLYPESFKKIGSRLPASETETLKIIERIIEEQSFTELRVSSNFGVTVPKIKGRISDLKRELIEPEHLTTLIDKEERQIKEEEESVEKMTKTKEDEISRKHKYIKRLREFNQTFELYEKKMQEGGVYDFDDTVLGLIDALSHDKEMLFEMRESFQFILADEHQDANGSQNEIIKFFKGDDAPNIFVVGDDKQSIFRFQGASLAHFYDFKDEFPGAKKIDLDQNYRSHRGVLDASHSLISSDRRSHQKLSANVAYAPNPIEALEFLTMEEEFSFVAKEIKEITEKDSNATVAVLARYNGTLFEFADFLKREKVAFSLKGEKSIFENFEYLKIESLFSALTDPFGKGKLLEALYLGLLNVPLLPVAQMAKEASSKRISFTDYFLTDTSFGAEEWLSASQSLLKELIAGAHKKPLLEFLRVLKTKLPSFSDPNCFNVLQTVFKEAEQLVRENRKAVLLDLVAHLEFLKRHNLALSVSDESSGSKVTLSSIHRSKGLEYDYVFLVDIVDKRFEKTSKRSDLLKIPGVGIETDMEEERRLLYVGITRARKHAVISYSLSDFSGGELAPSALVSEIDDSLIKKSKPQVSVMLSKLESETKVKEHVLRELRSIFLGRNFSVTALNNYLDCPWKYVWRNLLLVPDMSDFSNMLGTANHETLRRFHLEARKEKMFTDEELDKIIEDSILKEPFSEAELPVAKQKSTESIHAYLKTFVPFEKNSHVFVEESVSFPIKINDEKDPFEVVVTGKLDLCIEKNGEVEVVDFKSSKRKTRNDILGLTKNSEGGLGRQIKFYKFLWESANREGKVLCATLHFLTPERGVTLKETFELTPEDSHELQSLTEKTLKEIYNFEFWDNVCDDKECEYCRLASIFKQNLEKEN